MDGNHCCLRLESLIVTICVPPCLLCARWSRSETVCARSCDDTGNVIYFLFKLEQKLSTSSISRHPAKTWIWKIGPWKSYKLVTRFSADPGLIIRSLCAKLFCQKPTGFQTEARCDTSQLKRFVAPGYIVALLDACSNRALGALSTHKSPLLGSAPWGPASFHPGTAPSLNLFSFLIVCTGGTAARSNKKWLDVIATSMYNGSNNGWVVEKLFPKHWFPDQFSPMLLIHFPLWKRHFSKKPCTRVNHRHSGRWSEFQPHQDWNPHEQPENSIWTTLPGGTRWIAMGSKNVLAWPLVQSQKGHVRQLSQPGQHKLHAAS